MIYLSFGRPDGAGGYTRVAAFSTDDADRDWTAWPECTIKKDYIDSMGSFANSCDSSQAKGAIPTGTAISFSIIDWDETELARRSVGLVSGVDRFQGWAVDFVRTAGPQEQAPTGTDLDYYGGKPWYFVVDDVSCTDSTLQLSCVARWSLDAEPVGSGAGSAVVGLVVGGVDVSVPTPELEPPAAIRYRRKYDSWLSGRPGASVVADVEVTEATGLSSPSGTVYFEFECRDEPEAIRLFDELYPLAQVGSLLIVGSEYSEVVAPAPGKPSGVVRTAYSRPNVVFVYGSDFFRAVETDFSKVCLINSDGAPAPVISGAESITGWINSSGEVVSPKGITALSGHVLSFAPLNRNADGFVAATLIPSEVVFEGGTYSSTAGNTAYYGSTSLIPNAQELSELAAVDALDPVTLEPVASTSSSFGVWYKMATDFTLANIMLGIRPNDPEKAATYSRVFVDQATRLTARNNTVGVTSFNFGWALNSSPNENSGPGSPGGTLTREIQLSGGVENNQYQIFDDIANINASGLWVVGFPFLFAGTMNTYMQVLGVSVYGISDLAFGSNQAVVKPGASRFWAAPQDPANAAASLLPGIAEFAVLSSPSYVPTAGNWGEYLEPGTTRIDAAVKIAQEFWIDLYPRLISSPMQAPLAGLDFAPPTPSIGRVDDIVTEPTIQYDYYDGAFRGTAYIAHIDEEFDGTQSDRYHGGWGRSILDGTDYGYEIWRRCRDAWKAHGIRKAKTFDAPGVRSDRQLGVLYWVAEFYGSKRIDWLAFQPRFLEFTGKAAFVQGEISSGMPVTLPTALSDFAEYDLGGITTGRITEFELDPIAETARMLVMIAPVVTAGGVIDIWSDTINPAADRIVDTIDNSLDRVIDTLEG